MKITRIAALVAIAGQLWTAPVSLDAADKKVIKIDGSSTVYPITEAVAEEFQTEKKGAVHVTVGISGTGGGFKKFCRGEIDITGASRPILMKEMLACRETGVQYIELPVAFDALTVVVNPKNDWASSITVAELKKMWEPAAQASITKWNQVRASWPAQGFKLYGAGSDSGTFDYFTEAIMGKAKSSRGDYTATEDDNVTVQGVSNDVNAIGYFGMAYFLENQDKLKAVSLDSGKGPVAPNLQSVENGTYAPLSRPIFIYVSKKSAQRAEVKEFIEFYISTVPELAKEVGYVPLPAEEYTTVLQRFQKGQVGTAFGGHSEVGVKIKDLLKRTPKI
jgi:phosphate transport system substrate-binding protein